MRMPFTTAFERRYCQMMVLRVFLTGVKFAGGIGYVIMARGGRPGYEANFMALLPCWRA